MTDIPLTKSIALRLDERATDAAFIRTADGTCAGATSLPADFAQRLRAAADEVDRRRGRLPL